MRSSQSVTHMIRLDHGHVVSQFHKLEPGLAPGQRDALLRGLCTALSIHAQLEEEIFYPALQDAGVHSSALDHSVTEHDRMREGIESVRRLCADPRSAPDALHDAVNELMNVVLHHVADEETQVLPAAERFFGAERLQELGAKMSARRFELARPQAGAMVLDRLRSAPTQTALVTAGAALLAGSVVFFSQWRRRHRLLSRWSH